MLYLNRLDSSEPAACAAKYDIPVDYFRDGHYPRKDPRG